MTIGCAGDDEAMKRFGVPAALPVLHGKPIEQGLVNRRVALHTEVFAGFDDAEAKECLPMAVDDHAGREGLFGTHEPAREPQAVTRRIGGERWKKFGCSERNFIEARLVVAAIEDESVTGFAVFHDHDARVVVDFESCEIG